MKVARDMVVTLHYILTDDNNDTLESTEDSEPFGYLHGHGNVIPGFENGLEGAEIGQKLHLTIYPAQGYGPRNAEAIVHVPRDQFDPEIGIDVGMQVQAEGENGPIVFTIKAITDSEVTLDGNHPLAGEVLHYDIEIIDIRPASDEELAHGHAHTGHQHH